MNLYRHGHVQRQVLYAVTCGVCWVSCMDLTCAPQTWIVGQAECPPLPSTSNLAGLCLGGPVVEAGSPGSPSGLNPAAGWGGRMAVSLL